ncbi:MAG TPA: PIN domain-containing protein [Nitrososphaerales archaeon]|nr:PIN domain-containing protein [Nitrososphaerales archaeon]
MKRKLTLPKKLSIDSGVILAYYLGEDLGKLVKSSLLAPRSGSNYCSRQTISELFYMLCRRKGDEFASEAIDTLLKSGYLSVISSDEIDIQAGRYKCARTISLVDCYVLAVAKIQNVPAVFAKREEDVKKEIERKPLDVKLLFLEDYLSARIA